jgi:hypothetical protein
MSNWIAGRVELGGSLLLKKLATVPELFQVNCLITVKVGLFHLVTIHCVDS